MKSEMCVADCGTGFWADENDGTPQCSACIANCGTCSDSVTCTICDTGSGWFKSNGGACVNPCVDNAGA